MQTEKEFKADIFNQATSEQYEKAHCPACELMSKRTNGFIQLCSKHSNYRDGTRYAVDKALEKLKDKGVI